MAGAFTTCKSGFKTNKKVHHCLHKKTGLHLNYNGSVNRLTSLVSSSLLIIREELCQLEVRSDTRKDETIYLHKS